MPKYTFLCQLRGGYNVVVFGIIIFIFVVRTVLYISYLITQQDEMVQGHPEFAFWRSLCRRAGRFDRQIHVDLPRPQRT